jgi:hypothetical protein
MSMIITEDLFNRATFVVGFEHNGKRHDVSISPKGHWQSQLYESDGVSYIVFLSIDEDGFVNAEVEYITKKDYNIIDEGQGEQWLQADDFKVIASYQDGDIELSFTIDYDKGHTA